MKKSRPPVHYIYPFGSWLGRAALWLLLTVVLIFALFDIFGAMENALNGVFGWLDALRLAAALLAGGVFWAYATNLYPNVDVAEDGLRVEWFRGMLFIPWERVIRVKEANNLGFKAYAVQVKGLTPLHRLYGMFYLRRFYPAFVIFSNLPEYEKLLETVRKHLEA